MKEIIERARETRERNRVRERGEGGREREREREREGERERERGEKRERERERERLTKDIDNQPTSPQTNMATAIGSGVFHLANYIIFALFLLISAGIGLYHGCSGGRQRTTSEFLMGNRRLQMLPVAVPIFVSYARGVIVIGHPAEIYTRGTLFSMRALGHVLGCLLSSSLIVPFQVHTSSNFSD